MRSILLFFLLLLLPGLITATDYYVAKNGDDNNPGTETSPFFTIGKAAALMVAGDVCYVRAGTYREVLDPANPGTAAAPISFRAFEGEEVTIAATELLTDWRDAGNGRWSASVRMSQGSGNALYFNGKPLDWARWPNNTDGDPYTIDAMTVTGGTADRIDATDLPTGVDLTGGYVWYLGAHSGASWTQEITGVAGKRIDHVANDIERWPFNPHNPTVFRNGNRGRFFVFGAAGLLDHPGEWHYDAATSTVTFLPPGGMDPNAATIEYAVRDRTILVNQPYVVVEGIKTFGGMVNLKGDHCTIRGGEIRYGYQSLDELGNSDAQIGEGAVWVQASDILLEGNLIEGGSHNGISVQGWGGVSDVTVTGNEIREFNTVGNHSSPIRCRAPRSVITFNTIVGGGRDGIFIPAQDCEVSWNDVSDCMRINNDGGLFYVVGNDDDKNTVIHHNWFHDSQGPDYADGRCAGIYLDNDSKGYDVHHNVVWNISWTAVQMNWAAWNNDIFNNTFWDTGGAMGIWLNGRVQRNNRIWNNFADRGNWEGQDVADNLISSANPFADAGNLDFRPRSTSDLVDAGREIAGITDDFTGSAPDIGAY
ncbi:MAG: right-handed parallel beta-helix repeat-containing protein, partial [Bacteroidota bacterium]